LPRAAVRTAKPPTMAPHAVHHTLRSKARTGSPASDQSKCCEFGVLAAVKALPAQASGEVPFRWGPTDR
jgi:hypothetical protein